jgi:hypothetical protein
MYPFSTHNAKGICTDLIEKACANSVDTIDVREAYTYPSINHYLTKGLV